MESESRDYTQYKSFDGVEGGKRSVSRIDEEWKCIDGNTRKQVLQIR